MPGASRTLNRTAATRASEAPRASVTHLPVTRDDAAIVAGLRKGQVWARAALFDKYEVDVRRVVGHVLGADSELPDVIHDVFVRVLESLPGLQQPGELRRWIVTIAVRTGRERIRRRQRRRWLSFLAPEELPVMAVEADDPALREATRALYRALESLDEDDRIALALRSLAGLELGDVAEACGVSLATIKRRLARAEARFLELAAEDAALRDWVNGGPS